MLSLLGKNLNKLNSKHQPYTNSRKLDPFKQINIQCHSPTKHYIVMILLITFMTTLFQTILPNMTARSIKYKKKNNFFLFCLEVSLFWQGKHVDTTNIPRKTTKCIYTLAFRTIIREGFTNFKSFLFLKMHGLVYIMYRLF